MDEKNFEDVLIERIEKTNKFIELPTFKDGVLITVSEIFNISLLNKLNERIFPDPDGEFTLIFTGSGYQLKMEVKDYNEIYCCAIDTDSRDYLGELFSASLSDLEDFLSQNINI